MASPSSSFSQFTIGNLYTFQVMPNSANHSTSSSSSAHPPAAISSNMRSFFKQHYVPHNLRLVVTGRDDLNVLQSMVVQSFQDLLGSPKGGKAEQSDAMRGTDRVLEPPYPQLPIDATPVELPRARPQSRWIDVAPTGQSHSLTIVFSLPALRHFWREKPVSFLGHLLGHEGQGSILYVLKKAELATALASGVSISGPSFSIFTVDITLTQRASEQRALQNDIVGLVFAYLSVVSSALRQEGAHGSSSGPGELEWRWKEVQQMQSIEMAYQSKEQAASYASDLASRLQDMRKGKVPVSVRMHAAYLRPYL